MSNDLSKAVEALNNELSKLFEREVEIKKTINNLSAMMGKPQPFSDVELSRVQNSMSIRPDQFFGKPLAGAVKEYLKMRGQACTPQEINDGLIAGGFEFPKDWTEKYQLRNLSISLSKNSKEFVYVKSSNAYGLWEFYPDKKRERQKAQKGNAEVIEVLSNSKITVEEGVNKVLSEQKK